MPMAIVGFGGRILAGVGKMLRIYECGQKKLLKKARCAPYHSQRADQPTNSLTYKATYTHKHTHLLLFTTPARRSCTACRSSYSPST